MRIHGKSFYHGAPALCYCWLASIIGKSGRQTDRQTDRQTGRQAARQTDRQTEAISRLTSGHPKRK